MFPLTNIPMTYAPARPTVPRTMIPRGSNVMPSMKLDFESDNNSQSSSMTTASSGATSSSVSTSSGFSTPSTVCTPTSRRRLFSDQKQMPLRPWSKKMQLVERDSLRNHVAQQQMASPRLPKTRSTPSIGPIRTLPSMKFTVSPQRASISEVSRGLRFRRLPYKRPATDNNKKVDMITFEDLGAFCKHEKMDTSATPGPSAMPGPSFDVMEVDESFGMEVDHSLNLDQAMED